MNAIQQAQKAYSPTQMPMISDRTVEAQLFSKVTARLKKASKNAHNNFTDFAQALHDNQSMWSTLAADLMHDDNSLPAELRAQLISLSIFTQKHTLRVLKDQIDITPLLDINTSVLRGLTAKGT